MGGSIHPVLASYVSALTTYDVDLGAPGVHRGLPGTGLTFVLPIGEPLEVSWAGRPETRRARWSSVAGLHARPAQIHHTGTQTGIQLSVTTAGARALFGVPAAALAETIVELDELAPWLRQLPEQLAEAVPSRRGQVVQEALTRRLVRDGPPRPHAAVGHALAALTRGDGVQAVADDLGYSRRRLTTLVREESGMTPQQMRRLGRFEASRGLLGRLPLAEVAHRCGYADQAHLSREWSELAGCPPTTWLREEFPFLQDLDGGDPAGSSHE